MNLNQNIKEITFEESAAEVLKTLPLPLREYLAAGGHSKITQQMMQEYGLHVDQAAILEREIMLLIMGIETPGDFAVSLTEEAQIPEVQIGEIVQELNEEVFIPLRKAMQTGKAPAPSVSVAVPSPSSNKLNASIPSPGLVQQNFAPTRPVPVPQVKTVPSMPPPSYMPAPAPRPVVQAQPIAPGQRPAFASLPPKAAMPQPMVAPAPRPKLPVPPIQPSDIPVGITLGEPRQLKNLVPQQPVLPRTAPPPGNLPGATPSAPQMPARPAAPIVPIQTAMPAPVPMAQPAVARPIPPAPMSAAIPPMPSTQVPQMPNPVAPVPTPRPASPAIPGVRPVATVPAAPRPAPPPASPRIPGTPDPYREPIE